MNFKIAYDDVKKLLGLLEANAYNVVVPYIQILHNLEAEGEGEIKKFISFLQEEKQAIEDKLKSGK